jgi:hypothetical protein
VVRVKAEEVPLFVSPGGQGEGDIHLQVEGREGDSESIRLTPPTGSAFEFHSKDSAQRPPAFTVESETALVRRSTPGETAGGSGDSAWTPLRVRVQVPETIAYGEYTCNAVLVGNRVTDHPVRLKVVVNSLIVEWENGVDENGTTLWSLGRNPLIYYHFRQCRLVQRVRVRTALNDPIHYENLNVNLADFADDGGDTQPLPKNEPSDASPAATSLVLDLRFDKYWHASGRPYKLPIRFVCSDLPAGINSARADLWLHLLDPEDIFKPKTRDHGAGSSQAKRPDRPE